VTRGIRDAVRHIRQMVVEKDYAPNNSGIFLYAEIVTPLVMLALAFYHRRATVCEDQE
jgi:hypothetical protein